MKVTDLKNYGISQSVIQKLNALGYDELMEEKEKATKKGVIEGKSLAINEAIRSLYLLPEDKRGRRVENSKRNICKRKIIFITNFASLFD